MEFNFSSKNGKKQKYCCKSSWQIDCCGHSAFFENWCFNPNPNPNPDPNPNPNPNPDPNPNPYLLLQSIETSENKILHSLNMYARATTFFFLIKFQIHSAHI